MKMNALHFVMLVLPSVYTPPDWATLFADVPTGVTDAATAILPIAIPILVLLAGISISLKILGKFGAKR